MLKIVYGSRPAQQIDAAIMSAIYYGAVKKSAELAKIKGLVPVLRLQRRLPRQQRTAAAGSVDRQRIPRDRLGGAARGSHRHHRRRLGLPARTGKRGTAQRVSHGVHAHGEHGHHGRAERVVRAVHVQPVRAQHAQRRVSDGEPLSAEGAHGARLGHAELRMQLINDRGSVQNLPIPELEASLPDCAGMDQRLSVRHSAARGPFVCQSQSLNFFYRKPQFRDILTIMRDGWRAGSRLAPTTTTPTTATPASRAPWSEAPERHQHRGRRWRRLRRRCRESRLRQRRRIAIPPRRRLPSLWKLESGVQQDAFPRPSMPALNVDEAIASPVREARADPGCEACSG